MILLDDPVDLDQRKSILLAQCFCLRMTHFSKELFGTGQDIRLLPILRPEEGGSGACCTMVGAFI